MRQLFVNGQLADLDEKTAIGINIQIGDFSEPCQNKLSSTNTFQLPKSSRNKRIFEFSDSAFVNSIMAYDKITVDYYDGNVHLIKSAIGFLQNTSDSFQISIIQGQSFINTIKSQPLNTWMGIEIIKLQLVGGTGFIGDIFYSDPSGYHQLMDDLMGTFAPTTPQIEFYKPIPAVVETGSNFCDAISIKSIFQWFTDYGITSTSPTPNFYQINFLGTTAQIADFEKLVLPCPFITKGEMVQGSGEYGVYQPLDGLGNPRYINYYGKKTVFDLFKSVCNIFNAYLDIDEKNNIVDIVTFNYIIEQNTVINWSNKIISGSKATKYFFATGWNQKNVINYKYDDGLNITLGQLTVESENRNIDLLKEVQNGLFIHRSKTNVNGDDIYYIGTSDIELNPQFTQKGIEEISLYLINGVTTGSYPVNRINSITGYSMLGNYSSMITVLKNPVRYEVDLNLNILDIYNFTQKNLVQIDSLGGVFYVNKISGFNRKSKSGTKTELLKIR